MFLYTGSYTHKGAAVTSPSGKGISCFELDSKSGEIQFLHITKQRNPSYLAISEDRRYLYALEEMCGSLDPRIFAYKICETGELHLINSQKLIGDYACHLAIVANQLLVANYGSGNVLSFPIHTDGSLYACNQNIQHTGSGPNKERQASAHAHMVCPYRGKQMFVVDLGLDSAKAYEYIDKAKCWKALPTQDIVLEGGSGPRHMLWDANQQHAYVLSELSAEVFVFKNHTDKFEALQQISFLPRDFKGTFGGAAIRMHPNGKFLYTSCRGTDGITVFRIHPDEGTLDLVYSYSSGGKTPRDFHIDPSGKWLISANQDSNELRVFSLNHEKGSLKEHSNFSTGTPANICWG